MLIAKCIIAAMFTLAILAGVTAMIAPRERDQDILAGICALSFGAGVAALTAYWLAWA